MQPRATRAQRVVHERQGATRNRESGSVVQRRTGTAAQRVARAAEAAGRA